MEMIVKSSLADSVQSSLIWVLITGVCKQVSI